ncbi:MAG: 5-(carboxyamino)imidazole ribonucleotide mutase [Candidatus Eisenbacteria bacterium]
MSRGRPAVGIVLGSESDRAVANAAGAILDRLGVPFEVVIASAHRHPDEVRRYARGAERRGLKVIIAVAGLAAALPGVIASHTKLPVLGVPVPVGHLKGIDAILSMVQLPSGVPVGTFGLGETGGKNAALFAARMLARSDGALRTRLARYMSALRGGAREKKK